MKTESSLSGLKKEDIISKMKNGKKLKKLKKKLPKK